MLFFGLTSETPELEVGRHPSSHVALQCTSEAGTLSLDLFCLLPLPKKCHNIECALYGTVLGPKLLLAMGCVKLGEKNCVHLPAVGEQNAN